MIVDSSAIVAIVLDEPDGPKMVEAILGAARARISAANWFETTLVIDNRRDAEISRRLDQLFTKLRIEIVAFDAGMATGARDAHRRFGRGNHPAKLNFGDCIAYALAKSENESLLFKGNDFSQTDIQPALV